MQYVLSFFFYCGNFLAIIDFQKICENSFPVPSSVIIYEIFIIILLGFIGIPDIIITDVFSCVHKERLTYVFSRATYF